MIDYLISQGADVNLKMNEFETPLHMLSSRASYPIVNLFINAGANVNVQDM